jgi:uncharacterized protein YjbI with pentapeptide repeats
MEFALMGNAVLRGAILSEAEMSGAQLDRAVLTLANVRRRTCVGPDFAMPGSTRPIFVMHG